MAELIYCYKNKLDKYSLKDTLANISLSLMYQASEAIFNILIISSIYTWIYDDGLQLFSQTTFLNIILLFILQDFLYYWFHFTSHKVRWLWSSHITHHSSLRLNFSTAFRQSLTYPISGMWIFWLPLAYIGFKPDMVILIVALNLAFQFFVHTELIKKLGWAEKIFNTPSHHRVHHATNDQYIDKNFAGILIIWDKIFGTFEEEIEKPIYGITNQIYSFNPIKLTFHEWKSMFKDVVENRDLRYIWKPPLWKKYNKN
ncbi:MAG: sterol desaturase family protein [Burkholderiales bacterium]|nr:sterol desaturase family protein [Burkholderiales bacterium]